MEEVKATMTQQGLKMTTDQEKFAMALKTWRLRQGLTQKQVGDMWKTSRYTIMRAENAKNITWEQCYRLFAKLQEELAKERHE